MSIHRFALLVVAACLAVAGPLHAQQPPPAPGPVPLKVQIVIARYKGDRKISNIPYSMIVNASTGSKAQLRLGTNLPVATGIVQKDGPQTPSFTYQSIGTNIDCLASVMDTGRFKLDINVEDSSVSETGTGGATKLDVPAFQSFKFSDSIILKDGQSSEFTAATDKITGEVTKIDVTLTVIK